MTARVVKNGSSRALLTLLALAGALLIQMAWAEDGKAASPIEEFTVTPSTAQAGGHPDIKFKIRVGNRATQGFNDPCFCNDPKDIIVNLPEGVIGNPHVTPKCSAAQFGAKDCPLDAQVGMIAVLIYDRPPEGAFLVAPIYNMEAPPGVAGLLEFEDPLFGEPQYIEIKARTGSDYGLTTTSTGLERLAPIAEILQYMWGVPADPAHDLYRGYRALCQYVEVEPFLDANEPIVGGTCGPPTPAPSSSPRAPFLSNPTACTGPLAASIETTSFDRGVAHGETAYPAITGCGQLTFNPSLSAKPTTTETDSASGLDVVLSVPQVQSASTPTPSQIRRTVVRLPKGFTINANAADGKTICRDAEASFGTEDPARCPEFSKIGTTEIDSSALPGPISGYLYLGEPKPGDRYRFILTADGFATHIKLPGSLVPDPATGQLTAVFDNLPQSPLTEFKLHIFGSERGVLATPTQCGTYAVETTFTPWAAGLSEQQATQFFTLDSAPGGAPCPSNPRPHKPMFAASSTGNTAGAHSPFALEVRRGDGEQNLAGLNVKTPPGFAATLRGVSYCPEAAIAQFNAPGYTGSAEQAGSLCPASSYIGSVVAGAGAGSRPLYVHGRAYLAGPYKADPLSLVVVVPAVSGPYDLGNVVIRAAIDVDPVTAQVTAISDPLPQILEGVVLRPRFIQVNLDRRQFTLNPTNCNPFAVEAAVFGDEGYLANTGSLYQVANCARLPYRPKLSLRMSGGVRRRGHPAIRAVLSSGAGESNTRRVSVLLPKGQLLDNSHIQTICTRVQFNADSCPSGSKLGTVEARTPILDEPLTGSAYLRASSNKLPDLALDLEGQVDFTAVGRIDSVNGRLRSIFESVPDIPLGTVVVRLEGGAKGLLQNSTSLCGKSPRAKVKMTGQSGAVQTFRPKIDVACGSKPRSKRGRKAAR